MWIYYEIIAPLMGAIKINHSDKWLSDNVSALIKIVIKSLKIY